MSRHDETQAIACPLRPPRAAGRPLQHAAARGLAHGAGARSRAAASPRGRGLTDLSRLTLTEVGCGAGFNLLGLLRWGFAPQNLTGIELLPERHAQAHSVLPAATALWLGDATEAPIAPASQDLVLQATVFSSLQDDAFAQRLAAAMWSWLKPGGVIVWYDFTVNNPRNPDVRGVPIRRLRALFPEASLRWQRVTLAPPLARALCRVHPALYGLAKALPLLRTHVLAWLAKE